MFGRFNAQLNQLHDLNRLAGRNRILPRPVERITDSRVISRIVPWNGQQRFLNQLFTFRARQHAITHVVAPVLLRQTLTVFQAVFLRIQTKLHVATARTMKDITRRFRGGEHRPVQYDTTLRIAQNGMEVICRLRARPKLR